MVKRPVYLNQIATAVRRSSVTALLGPRQSGETTLARVFGKDSRAIHLDLEFKPDRRRLGNPELALGSLSGLVVLDEIQMTPELFHVLRVLVDRPENQARFPALGSASPHILRDVAETLGRSSGVCRTRGI